MAYGIAFDIDTNCYRDFIKDKFPDLDDIEALKRVCKKCPWL